MRLKVLLFATCLSLFPLLSASLFSQCPPGGVFTLSSQAEIDAFAQNYPDCIDFEGALVIQESTPGDITNLNGLGNLVIVNDLLIFTNDSLRDLSGLFLLLVRQGLVIQNNRSLENLTGLDSLRTVVGNLSVINNPALASLHGLNRLTRALGTTTIADNPSLDTLGGLDILLFGGELRIENNPELQSLRPMRFVRRMTQGVTIRNNPKLNDFHPDLGIPVLGGNVSLDGLPRLPSLDFLSPRSTGNLTISNCPLITDLSSFDQLADVSGSLTLANNDLLSDLSGISFLNPDSLTSIVVTDNPALNTCAIEVICLALRQGEVPVTVTNNGPDCSTLDDLRNQCDALPLCPYDLTIDDETDAAAFAELFPGCDQINGSLIIRAGARNLTPLRGIKRVRNDIRILGADLENLDGLQDIEEVTSLEILGATNLQTLAGLEGLQRVGFNVTIDNATELTSLEGLGGLKGVENQMVISEVPELTSLVGLDSLQEIGFGGIWVRNARKLRNLTGLSQLQRSNGIIVQNCFSFRSLDGLDSLRELGGLIVDNASSMTRPGSIPTLKTVDRLVFVNNAGLSSLNGLEHLDTVKLGLIFIDNGQLRDLSALNDVEPGILGSTGFYELSISGNSSLSICAVPLICAMLEDPDRVSSFIEGNREGCNSRAEIEEICLTSVDNFSASHLIPAYPNPTPGPLSLGLHFSGKRVAWRLLSVRGELLDSGVTVPSTFDFSWLPRGSYFLYLQQGNKRYQTQFVRQ
jgi:hypothetical protein